MSTEPDKWKEDCENQISAIANHLVAGRIGFLFGAGMSIPSGGISGEQLALQLIRKAFYPKFRDSQHPMPTQLAQDIKDVAHKFPLEAIAEGAMNVFTFELDELEKTLKADVFAGKEPQSHDGHKSLSSLVKKLNIRTLYTTNWDNLLEKEIGSSSKSITENKLRTLEAVYSAGETAIIHLHGTFDDNPLICERDLMDPERPLFQIFMADLISKAFVFVGYSLSDFNIRALYSKSREILERRSSKLTKKTFIVAPPSSESERHVASEVWKSRGAIYIPMGAEEFFKALYTEVVTKALDELKTKIRIQLGVTLADLQSKIESIKKVFPQFEDEAQVLHYLEAIIRGAKP